MYAVNESFFDIGIMLGMGILGFVLERRQIPIGPIVLGIVLGSPLEGRFIQTLTGADGSPLAFFNRRPGGTVKADEAGVPLALPVLSISARCVVPLKPGGASTSSGVRARTGKASGTHGNAAYQSTTDPSSKS